MYILLPISSYLLFSVMTLEEQIAHSMHLSPPAFYSELPNNQKYTISSFLQKHAFPSGYTESKCIRQMKIGGLLGVVRLSLIHSYITTRTSQVAQMVKNLPAVWETGIRSLGWKDTLEQEMATHSSILTWRIPQTEEHSGLPSMGLQRVRQD